MLKKILSSLGVTLSVVILSACSQFNVPVATAPLTPPITITTSEPTQPAPLYPFSFSLTDKCTQNTKLTNGSELFYDCSGVEELLVYPDYQSAAQKVDFLENGNLVFNEKYQEYKSDFSGKKFIIKPAEAFKFHGVFEIRDITRISAQGGGYPLLGYVVVQATPREFPGVINFENCVVEDHVSNFDCKVNAYWSMNLEIGMTMESWYNHGVYSDFISFFNEKNAHGETLHLHRVGTFGRSYSLMYVQGTTEQYVLVRFKNGTEVATP